MVELLKGAGWYEKGPRMGVREGVDPRDLAAAGWGVVFAKGADPKVREALAGLLEHRREQAGERYLELAGDDGYRPDEGKWTFLSRFKAGPGPVDPDKLPYYLLLVGDPQAIPYPFQYQLDVEHAVGRVCFETVEEYAAYASNVVAAEKDPASFLGAGSVGDRGPRVTFFAPRNRGDRVTERLCERLVAPLAEHLAAGCEVRTLTAAEATKAGLARELGADAPALLFTAAHGVKFKPGDRRQEARQGALLCQDWPGPGTGCQRQHYFSAEDVAADARPRGLIAFQVACYGGGTPRWSGFAGERQTRPPVLAERAFVARLPQRLLAAGALAAVGHVDRAWGYSYLWAGDGVGYLKSTLDRLVAGEPIGSAMDDVNHRYSELAADLTESLRLARWGRKVDDSELARVWTAHNDARSYVVFGDPAVRLPGSEGGKTA